jgi:hypothetical protein
MEWQDLDLVVGPWSLAGVRIVVGPRSSVVGESQQP